MLAYGATFELTPREKGMKGRIARATEIVASTRPARGCRSSSRIPANIDVHVRTTARGDRSPTFPRASTR